MKKHTKTDWVVVKNHPVFEHSILIMSDLVETDKSFKKGKLICKIDEVRGDSFTRIDSEESNDNVELILSSPVMYHELSEIKHYAETALKSLDNQSLSEVRGMLEGIIEKSKKIIK